MAKLKQNEVKNKSGQSAIGPVAGFLQFADSRLPIAD
jgi:hypothetical protein